jgi:endonuclease/exonuclease/phosphatase family metal-dependent hydrolase
MRVWPLALFLFIACDSADLTSPPNGGGGSSGDPSSQNDGGTGDDDGGQPIRPVDAGPWGDPTTTHVAGMLRLEQLNVRRLFDAVCDSGNCTGSGAYEDLPTQTQFDARILQIATDLTTIGADVITLAEVENQNCVNALQAKLKDLGFDYPVAYVAETGSPGSVDVAVVARGKLGKIVNNRKYNGLTEADGTTKTEFAREFAEIHITLGSREIIIYPAHFIAKVNDDPARRLAEATAAHNIVVATGDANPTLLTMMSGDLNDTPDSAPLQALTSDGKLLRVASDIDPSKQGTYLYQGQDTAIDHIFVTKNHASNYVAKSATVVRDSGKQGFAGSDHATIYADFTLP